MVILVFQDFYLSCFQRADQGSMVVQYFEQTHDSGQLHAIYIGAEKFLLGC